MTKSTFPLRSQQYTAWLDSASVVFHYNWAPHQGGWNLHSKEDLNSSDIISTCHKQPWFINSMVPPKCLFLTITLNVFSLNIFLIPGSIWLLIKDSWKESRVVQGTNLQTVSLRSCYITCNCSCCTQNQWASASVCQNSGNPWEVECFLKERHGCL